MYPAEKFVQAEYTTFATPNRRSSEALGPWGLPHVLGALVLGVFRFNPWFLLVLEVFRLSWSLPLVL